MPRRVVWVLLAAAVLVGWGSVPVGAESKFWYDENGPGWVCEHPPDRPSEEVCRPAGGGSPSVPEPLTPCEQLHQSWKRHGDIALMADDELPPDLARRDDDVQAWAFGFAVGRYVRALERGCEWAVSGAASGGQG